MLNGLPGDPVMLLSVVNTKLRDQYHDLNVLCDDMNVAKEEIESKLNAIDYFYDSNRNQFAKSYFVSLSFYILEKQLKKNIL